MSDYTDSLRKTGNPALWEAADRIEELEAENERLRCSDLVLRAQVKAQVAELERTRQAWVNGDEPHCEDVCAVACKGPCGVTS